MADPDLLIVGGTARAAAWCAVRAGLRVAALDRFNDLDLRAVAEPCFLWDGSGEQLERVVGELGVPWIYGGALENDPALVDRCAALAPLRGNDGDALRAVRDPVRLQTAFAAAGLPTLAVRDETDPPPPDGTWLLKPRASCGGHQIAVWDRDALDCPTRWGPHYFQEFLRAGPRAFWKAVPFDAGEDGADVRLLGGFGGGGTVADGFLYRETRGPTRPRDERLPPDEPPRLARDWARAAVRAFGLRGLGGVDLACGWRDGHFTAAVEVNPRFTSSMELCEPGCGPFDAGDACAAPPKWERAKRILYADRAVRVGRLPVFGPHECVPDGPGWLADVPAPGSVLPPRNPICTIFAAEPREDHGSADRDSLARGDRLRAELDRREAQVRAVLSPA